jgi:hypothetical protein
MISKQVRRTAAVAALALVAAQAALAAESPVVRYTAADQARARALVLKTADVPGWKGGQARPNPAATSPCADWSPKQADLVVTGAAKSQYTYAGGALTVSSESLVYRTTRMAALDWQRTVVHPDAVRCIRSSYDEDPSTELVSFARTSFPKVAQYTVRYRVVLDVPTGAGAVRMFADVVLFGQGRQLVNLALVAPYRERAAADAAERRLARLLAARLRA